MSSSVSRLTRLHDAILAKSPVDAVLNQLSAALTADARSISTEQADIDSTLFGDPFPIINLLTPLLANSGSDSPSATTASTCLDLVVQTSSAKEVVISLDDRLAALGTEDDDDDDDGDYLKGGSRELASIIRLYGLALPRIRTANPGKFISAAGDSISNTIGRLSDAGAFEEIVEAGPAEGVLRAIATLVRTLAPSPWVEKAKEICVAELQRLLLTTVAALHLALPAGIAESFFLSKYSRYRIPGRTSTPFASFVDVWTAVGLAADSITLHPRILLSTSILSFSSASLESVVTSLGSFILLTHRLAASPSSPDAFGSSSPSQLLQETLPILMLALSGGDSQECGGGAKGVGVDEALFWTWWCVEAAVQAPGAHGVDEGVLFTLVELLSTMASLSSSPSTRFLAFRLVSTLIVDAAPQEETQLMLLKDLIEDCPFDPMRIAALSLLQEVLVRKFQDPATFSLFTSPLLLRELGDSFLRCDALLVDSSAVVDRDDFMEHHQRLTVQKLALGYFLLVRDRDGTVGLRTPHILDEAKRQFWGPLRTQVDEWLRGTGDAAAGRMELELLSDGLGRIEEVL